jgi:hypothetical protein
MPLSELGATPWVDKTWRSAMSRIAAKVPEAWLPKRMSERPLRVAEYGCGHYGCVMPTSEPGLVVKLTSDPAEALFVAWMLSVERPEWGIVEYKRIYALEGAGYRGRALYVLWRSEAYAVGSLSTLASPWSNKDTYEQRSAATGIKKLGDVKFLAGRARDQLKRWRARVNDVEYAELLRQVWNAYENGAGRNRFANEIAERLNLVRGDMQELESTYLMDGIGHTLLHYLERGVLLADVHANNIGRDDPDGGAFLITDPGHAVVFNPDVTIPQIETV